MDRLKKKGLGRREFIRTAAAALFAGVIIQITGCSTEDDHEHNVSVGDVTASISGNHPSPHKATLTKAQIMEGGSVTLDIQGSADHSHSVNLSAEQMAAIKAGDHVMVSCTSAGGHEHLVMFN